MAGIHLALAPDAQVALTLREVCGLTTEAIARSYAQGLALVDDILKLPAMQDYHLAHAARAELCSSLQRWEEARNSYQAALALTQPEPERRFLERRVSEIAS